MKCAGQSRATQFFPARPCDLSAEYVHKGQWHCYHHHPPYMQERAKKMVVTLAAWARKRIADIAKISGRSRTEVLAEFEKLLGKTE